MDMKRLVALADGVFAIVMTLLVDEFFNSFAGS